MDGLETITRELFDYAGMFPPARKSLEEAIAISLEFPRTLERPYLVAADLVVAASHLDALVAQAPRLARPFEIAVLGTELGGDDRVREPELRAIATLEARTSGKLIPVSYECKGSARDEKSVRDILQKLPDPINVCLEPDLTGDGWETAMTEMVDLLSEISFRGALKVRGGGDRPIDTLKLAAVLDTVSIAGVRLKATGGLHHPIIEPERYGNQLGFLNLTVGPYLWRHESNRKLGLSWLKSLLDNGSVERLVLTEGIGYGSCFLPLPDLLETMRRYPFTIGTCNIHEPDEDLARLFNPN